MAVPDRGGRLCSRVTAELGGRIVAGDYVPDQVLPTEAELCGIFGVSRTTVREAMKRLHGKGLVAGTPRNGTRVLPTARWNQFDAELLSWRMQRGVTAEIVDQLYEVRDCFEPRACALAAGRGNSAEKALIKAHFETLADASLGTEQRVAADLAFHLAIFAATGNIVPDIARFGDPNGAAAVVRAQPTPIADVAGGAGACTMISAAPSCAATRMHPSGTCAGCWPRRAARFAGPSLCGRGMTRHEAAAGEQARA